MKMLKLLLSALFVATAMFQPGAANEATVKPETFKPFELTGDWYFTNNNSGVRYGGDVKVSIVSIDATGVMRGKVSYDGRQTNDVCSTRGLFSDDPVDAEVIRGANEYKISFNIKCAKGNSPRLRSWTLTCENNVCTRPEVASHGKGLLTLNEKR